MERERKLHEELRRDLEYLRLNSIVESYEEVLDQAATEGWSPKPEGYRPIHLFAGAEISVNGVDSLPGAVASIVDRNTSYSAIL